MCALALIASALLAGCVEEHEVRDACLEHGGVNAVSGSNSRQYVACKDGHYQVVR